MSHSGEYVKIKNPDPFPRAGLLLSKAAIFFTTKLLIYFFITNILQ